MDNSLSINDVSSKASLKYYTNKIETDAKESGYLDFNSYLKVLASQMSNQDFNDPMSDSEFLQQMSSYSMMEAIGQMNAQSQISYATSLVGKAVTVNDGEMMSTGLVDSVLIDDGVYSIIVNGNKYTTDKVTNVMSADDFKGMKEFIGRKASMDDGKDQVSGKVTDIVVNGGVAYGVINGRPYELSSLTFKDENADAQTAENAVSSLTDDSEAADTPDNTPDEEPESVFQTAEVKA